MPLRSYKADLARSAVHDPLDLRGDHHRHAAQAAAGGPEARQRPQPPGPHDRPPSWRRREAHYRRIDFRRDKWDVPAKLATIEYDPNRSARIGLLHYADGEKRYILVPHGLKVGRHRDRRRDAPRRAWATPCRCRRSRWAPSCTTSSWCPARAARSSAPPAPPRSCWPRRATTPWCACPRARCAASTCAAWPPSARSATSTTRTRASARPVAPATWASGPRCAAWS